MESNLLLHFKNKLLSQKREVEYFLKEIKENDVADSNLDMQNELSNYDNHPADAAGNLYDKERGLALKEHQVSLMKKINEALLNIDKGCYGKCKNCGKDILIDRLEFIPYTQYCAKCQKQLSDKIINEKPGKSMEESVYNNTFGYGYKDYKDKIGFDAEDSYQSVGRINNIENVVENYYDDEEFYVEPVERISNKQYENQLPD